MMRTLALSILCLWLAFGAMPGLSQATTDFDTAVVGSGGLLLNARTVRFHLAAYKAGSHISGYFDLIELSPTASNSARVQMTRITSLELQGATAVISGTGTLNRRPALIRVEATDFGQMLTVLDQLRVTAYTVNSAAPYVVEGSVWPGDIKIYRRPTILHRVRGQGQIRPSNTTVGTFSMDIFEVIPSSNTQPKFQGGFSYIARNAVATRRPVEIKSVSVNSLVVDGNTAIAEGVATMNGSSAFFVLRLFDGRLSPLPDTFAIEVTRGPAVLYRASGNVLNGDIDLW